MKLGFICPNLPGHLNPLTALARHLQLRNHEVVFLYSSGAVGLPFVSSGEKDQVNENLPEVSKMQGEDAWQFGARVLLTQTESMLKSLPAVVQANGVDAVVIDTVQFYAELGRSSWAYRTYTSQPHCTMTTRGTPHFPFMGGLIKRLLRLWPETGRVSPDLLRCWKRTTRASKRMPKPSD
jgi:hypothetical protein